MILKSYYLNKLNLMELCCNFCETMQLKMLHIARIKQHKEEDVFV